MKAQEVARRYAVTLLEASSEAGVTAEVRGDVDGVVATLRDSVELQEALHNRLIAPQNLRNVIEAVFGGRTESLTLNFLLLLADRRRTALLAEILDSYVELDDARVGVVTVEVRSAICLTPDQESRLHERLQNFTGRQVRLQTHVDAALKGGVIARVDDTVFDGSLDAHLARLRRRLSGV